MFNILKMACHRVSLVHFSYCQAKAWNGCITRKKGRKKRASKYLTFYVREIINITDNHQSIIGKFMLFKNILFILNRRQEHLQTRSTVFNSEDTEEAIKTAR